MNKRLTVAIVAVGIFVAGMSRAGDWVSVYDTQEITTWNSRLKYYRSLEPAEGSIDCTVTIRMRAFGDPVERKRAWESEGLPLPAPMNDGYFFMVSGKAPEIWLDLKKDVEGNLIVSDLVLGHELLHILAHKVTGIANPDHMRINFDQMQKRLEVKGEREE